MSNRVSRRQFGLAAAAVAATTLPAKAADYPGPLAAASGKVNMQDFDPVHYTLERYKSAPLRLTFNATNRAAAEAWQHELRAKITDLLGGFPQPTPLNARSLETRDFPNYRREKFVFESRPGVGVLAYLLTPAAAKAPFATALCIPGHGRGVDDIVGIDEHGNDRTTKVSYAYDFAIQAVEHNMAALAIEPMGFGCRRDAKTQQAGQTVAACQPVAGSALLFGETILGWRVWDIMRAIDWIQTRPDLDPKRIGCVGISGGGTCTQFAGALDTRIKAVLISGYLNTFRDSIMSMSHCIDNYVPGILNWAESYDVASLIAPRPLFSEGGARDPIFPAHATRASFGKVQRIYEVFGVPERAQQEIFDGEHVFHGAKGLPFLAAALAT